jgi:hypothetical protein
MYAGVLFHVKQHPCGPCGDFCLRPLTDAGPPHFSGVSLEVTVAHVRSGHLPPVDLPSPRGPIPECAFDFVDAEQ